MKSAINVVVILALVGMVGCSANDKIPSISVPDGSAEKAASPIEAPAEKALGDDVIAPTTEVPAPAPTPAPATDSGKKDEPPALPTPPKVPETSSDPGVILYVPPVSDRLGLPPVVTSVAMGDGIFVDSPDSAGTSEASASTFRCGPNQVVTGFEYSREAVDAGCGEGWSSGCGPEVHMAALKITCSPLSLSGVDNISPATASVWPTAETVAGKRDAVINSTASETSCKAGVGVAHGIIGRVDGELKSFGLSCYDFHAWKEGVALLPTFNHTTTCDDGLSGDYEYGCSPGFGGTPFEKSCESNQALVGLTIKYSKDRVLGITALQCADVKAAVMSPIFGTMDK